LQSVKHTLPEFPGEPLRKSKICVPLQPANEEAAFLKEAKNKKNKTCGSKKGSYLCSPKTRGAEKREILKAIFSIKIEKVTV
jgi:hypothetical protein